MDMLAHIVAFWRDCIASEGALEQSFAVNNTFRLGHHTRARLYGGGQDPFIFADPAVPLRLESGDLYDFVSRSSLKGQELYFGYPLLMFYDRALKQHRVAPVFVMRLSAELQKETMQLTRAESAPVLGSKAFERLGLHQEEIVALNTEVGEVFAGASNAKLDTILYLLKRETTMTFVEGIDPNQLSQNQTIHPYSGTVIYNRAVVYASEASAYNLHILNDLNQLVRKRDLAATSLSYLRSSRESSV